MLSEQTLTQAAEIYFQENLPRVLGENFWRPLTRCEVYEAVEAIVKLTSEEMDGQELKYEISDHCMHWLVDLTVVTPETESTIEIPINRVSSAETHIGMPHFFLMAILSQIVSGENLRILNPVAIRQCSDKLEEIITRCKGCEANIVLQEVKFHSDTVFFCFRVQFDAGLLKTTFVTYEIPWPRT
jgi:hypothetical protein